MEQLWVEVNDRVNYPLNEILVKMSESSELNMDDEIHKYCSSWFSINISNVGLKLFVNSWNAHSLPGIILLFSHTYIILARSGIS